MSNRMDKDSMELVKAVLKSEIDDLIQRFHNSSGWSVFDKARILLKEVK